MHDDGLCFATLPTHARDDLVVQLAIPRGCIEAKVRAVAALHVQAMAGALRVDQQHRYFPFVPLRDDVAGSLRRAITVDARRAFEPRADALAVVLVLDGHHEGLTLQLFDEVLERVGLGVVQLLCLARAIVVRNVDPAAGYLPALARHHPGAAGYDLR